MATAKTEKQFNSIVLIPTDFSETCGNAISHGIKLAQFLGFKACILHVINKETKAALKQKNVGPDYVDWRLKEYKRYYEKKYSVTVDTMAVEGSIFTTIAAVATEIKANLMVLGTHGKRGLQHVFGSFALKVVLESPIPVVVVQKRSFKEGYQRIIFPVSYDADPRQGVDWAILMSKLFHAPIHLFKASVRDAGQNSAISIITKQITDIFDSKKIPYEISKAEKPGDFTSQVLSYSKYKNADLVMIMTQSNTEAPGFNMSAWNERLMFNENQIPVMCVNPVQLGYVYYEWNVLA